MDDCPGYSLESKTEFDRIVVKLKRRDPVLLKELDRSVEKILREPMLGKPMRNILRNYRRVHVSGSFVLLYEVQNCIIRLIDFDHHDRIYKKYQ